MDKKTKIVCTIGPSTWDQEVMRQLIENGMNCARVNGAFADPAELDKVKDLVKNVSDDVSLMVDVKGPEIRMNKFAEPKKLSAGMEIMIGGESDEIYPANYPNISQFIQPGHRVVVGDGDVELVVERVENGKIYTKVSYGEELKPGKALNLPDTEYTTEVLTDKDKENLRHAIETGWDFVSASFITSAESAQIVKDFIGESKMKVIAKIEDGKGVENIDSILNVVDGVMIARGGLGVELGLENVPIVQRHLTAKCNEAGKPVITATQMLESMTHSPRPTRAEASDVVTSVLLGTDAVMLSGESSAGEYPVEAVKFLTSASLAAEKEIIPAILESRAIASSGADSITKAAAEMCKNMGDEIDAVIIVTQSGTTARLLSRHNIKQPIYAFTSSDFNKRTLLLSKGINRAFVFEGIDTQSPEYTRDKVLFKIIDMAKGYGVVNPGQKVLFIGKTPIDAEGYFPNLFEVVEVA